MKIEYQRFKPKFTLFPSKITKYDKIQLFGKKNKIFHWKSMSKPSQMTLATLEAILNIKFNSETTCAEFFKAN